MHNGGFLECSTTCGPGYVFGPYEVFGRWLAYEIYKVLFAARTRSAFFSFSRRSELARGLSHARDSVVLGFRRILFDRCVIISYLLLHPPPEKRKLSPALEMVLGPEMRPRHTNVPLMNARNICFTFLWPANQFSSKSGTPANFAKQRIQLAAASTQLRARRSLRCSAKQNHSFP